MNLFIKIKWLLVSYYLQIINRTQTYEFSFLWKFCTFLELFSINKLYTWALKYAWQHELDEIEATTKRDSVAKTNISINVNKNNINENWLSA